MGCLPHGNNEMNTKSAAEEAIMFIITGSFHSLSCQICHIASASVNDFAAHIMVIVDENVSFLSRSIERHIKASLSEPERWVQ